MFRNPFSFEGRIRRTEYGVSMIISTVLSPIVIGSVALIGSVVGIVGLTLLVFSSWFVFAQGAKRCHDLGNSGWWQLIPFYGFWLLFADGEPGHNQYGDNPKGIGAKQQEDTPTPVIQQSYVNSDTDVLEQVERLASLKEKGIISHEEFETQKQKLLEKL